MPNADRNRNTTKPAITPTKEVRPAAVPWLRERERMYIMFGPGVMAKPKLMRVKADRAARLGMAIPVLSQQRLAVEPPRYRPFSDRSSGASRGVNHGFYLVHF